MPYLPYQQQTPCAHLAPKGGYNLSEPHSRYNLRKQYNHDRLYHYLPGYLHPSYFGITTSRQQDTCAHKEQQTDFPTFIKSLIKVSQAKSTNKYEVVKYIT